jgi:hypothetical protein
MGTTERNLHFKGNENIPTLTTIGMNPDYGPNEFTTFLLNTNIFMIFLSNTGKHLNVTLMYDTISSFHIIPTPTLKSISFVYAVQCLH